MITVLITMMLSSMAILTASSEASLELRQAVGGAIKIDLDQSNSRNWNCTPANGGYYKEYTGKVLTDEVIESALDIEGVTGYNGLSDTSVEAVDYQFVSGNIGWNDSVTLPATNFSENYNFFSRGSFELIEGRHFTDEDKNVCIISNTLADLNNLKVGDKIHMRRTYGVYDNGNEERASVAVTITGIYKIHTESKVSFETASTLLDNRIIIDSKTLCDLEENEERKYENGIYIYVDDPRNIERVISEIKRLDIDMSSFSIYADDSEYDTMSSSLQALQSLTYILFVCIVLFGTIILTIVLTFFVRGRIRETGILLSVGIDKLNIVAQFIIELTMITIVASAFSLGGAKGIAEVIGSILINNVKDESVQPGDILTDDDDEYYFDITGKYESYDTSNIASVSELQITIEMKSFIIVCLTAFLVIIISIMISCLRIFKFKPREILIVNT